MVFRISDCKFWKNNSTITPYPTFPPGSTTTEWTQHAHDAQLTGCTPMDVPYLWRWKWVWNGPTASGELKKAFWKQVFGTTAIERGRNTLEEIHEGDTITITDQKPGI